MNLHPEIAKLIAAYAEKKSISIEEKQRILNKALELKQDLTLVVLELEKAAQNPKYKASDLSKCEACGDFMPALERVCPSCKNVKSSSGSVDVRLDDLIFESENLLTELKSSYSISFSKRLLKNGSFSVPVFIGASFILGWNFNSDVLAGVFFCSLLLWFFVIRRKKRNIGSIQNSQNSRPFQLLNSQLENKIRLLELYFGNDVKTRDHLIELEQELFQLNNKKNKLIIYEISIYLTSLLLLVTIGYFSQI